MRRLSIIDVAGSQQPIANEDGRSRAVFNGEIYNFPELRAELGAAATACDRAATRRRSCTSTRSTGPTSSRTCAGCSRSRCGTARAGGWCSRATAWASSRCTAPTRPVGLAFASEVKALIAGGLVEPELDPMGAELFLAHGFVPGPRTLFAGVRKLDAGAAAGLGGRPARRASGRTGRRGTTRRAAAGASWEEDQEQLLDLLRERRARAHGQRRAARRDAQRRSRLEPASPR